MQAVFSKDQVKCLRKGCPWWECALRPLYPSQRLERVQTCERGAGDLQLMVTRSKAVSYQGNTEAQTGLKESNSVAWGVYPLAS